MTDATDRSRTRLTRARVTSSAVGALFAVVAGVFVTRALVRDRAVIGTALDGASPAWLVLAALLATVGMLAIALPWRHAIRLLGDDLPLGEVVRRYFVGEIGKYVPGGVWPVLGRGELAARCGVRRTAAYGSVLLSLLALYLAAMLLVVAGLPALLAGGDGTGPIAVLVLLPVGLLALHPRALTMAVRIVERLGRRHIDVPVPSWTSEIGLVARYVPAWLAIGGATWAIARSLDPHARLLEIGVATILAWLVGFVLVPVPGGVGVREAAFVAAAGSLDPGVAATVAIGARVVFVVVDAVGALVGSAMIRSTGGAQPARSPEAV